MQGARVRFREGVPVRYWQDFRFCHEPLPSDRTFTVERDPDHLGEVCLTGPGFGVLGEHGQYGNGSIYVRAASRASGAGGGDE